MSLKDVQCHPFLTPSTRPVAEAESLCLTPRVVPAQQESLHRGGGELKIEVGGLGLSPSRRAATVGTELESQARVWLQ